jgi:hypothetical protein
MKTPIDLTGQRFGKLVALSRTTGSHWLCSCDCGKTSFASLTNLRNGRTKSCGCGQLAALRDFNCNKPMDETGNKFGKLLVLGEAELSRTGKRRVRCLCDCGKTKEVFLGGLRRGVTTSCGCNQKIAMDKFNKSNAKHGHSGGTNADGSRKISATYSSWKSMQDRCLNPKIANYQLYGGRGISIYAGWMGDGGFESFLAHIGERPESTTLDRIDVNGNYEPGNVRWADAKTQALNRRPEAYKAEEFKAKVGAITKALWQNPAYREKVMESRRRSKLEKQT